ncbi:hypothetical protein TRAPUB_8854 [Trametes pubescens]|uniref:Prolyl 4-hydroxylase alpha subunit domain-containing protein n=1 Tax=Trametes pubescens TaxID=154538 RepID=A0A1M2W430_TRAPU|nr:hypothetical protein TRAPUB_8854 [Trametes pubescens]
MAKKARTAATPASSASPSKPPTVKFPELSPKEGLECRAILEDQILLIDDFFSPEECKAYVKFIDSLPLELTPPKKRGEAERVNHRMSIPSVDFAQRMHAVLAPHLPEFPYPAWAKRPSGAATNARRPAHSLNSNIRVYKYTQGQYFGPHYDDAVRDSETGAKSEWTLLIYLTGSQDGVEGGEDCMLHEGSPVTKGTKYVLRSDLMFMK